METAQCPACGAEGGSASLVCQCASRRSQEALATAMEAMRLLRMREGLAPDTTETPPAGEGLAESEESAPCRADEQSAGPDPAPSGTCEAQPESEAAASATDEPLTRPDTTPLTDEQPAHEQLTPTLPHLGLSHADQEVSLHRATRSVQQRVLLSVTAGFVLIGLAAVAFTTGAFTGRDDAVPGGSVRQEDRVLPPDGSVLVPSSAASSPPLAPGNSLPPVLRPTDPATETPGSARPHTQTTTPAPVHFTATPPSPIIPTQVVNPFPTRSETPRPSPTDAPLPPSPTHAESPSPSPPPPGPSPDGEGTTPPAP